MSLVSEINRRRTFGIISHPDAGKTTLTEKLLLFGGAIQEAGKLHDNKLVFRRGFFAGYWRLLTALFWMGI